VWLRKQRSKVRADKRCCTHFFFARNFYIFLDLQEKMAYRIKIGYNYILKLSEEMKKENCKGRK